MEITKRIKQIGSLYSTMLIGLVIGVGTSVINTRLLGPQLYGDFKFLVHLFQFAVMFLTLGFFYSGSRLLAQEKNRDNVPRLKGTMLAYAAAVSAVMIVGFFIFSFFEDQIYNNQLGEIIRLFSPFLFIFPFMLCLEGIFTGANEIYKLSVFRLFPKLFYLVTALAIHWLFGFSLKTALLLNLSGFALIIAVMVILLKPDFSKVKESWPMLRKENKSYGFQVYISHLATTATARAAALSIAFFIDSTNVGYYALAVTVTQPLSMMPRVVGTAFFKDFANRDSIPLKATVMTIVLSLAALAVFLLLIRQLFFVIYPEGFAPALDIVYVFAGASIIHGFGDYVNRFLGAHGRGKDMRNGAFVVAGSNILGYTLLVKVLLLWGAVITRTAAACLYLGAMVYFYRKRRREKKVTT
ncbi:MAG: oligosaccharide flippase family protein [bacterium]|nr:oligosaccharide flippase family protein [bacterium]